MPIQSARPRTQVEVHAIGMIITTSTITVTDMFTMFSSSISISISISISSCGSSSSSTSSSRISSGRVVAVLNKHAARSASHILRAQTQFGAIRLVRGKSAPYE